VKPSKRWLILIVSLLLIACGANNPVPSTPTITSTPVPASIPIAPTATRTPSPPSTIAVAVVPTLPLIIVTNPLPTASPWPTLPPPTEEIVAQPALTARPLSTPLLTSTPLVCPPWPTPTAEKTQAAVQHFEHGLMFWLSTRNEIWALISSPTSGKFYWRVLPNLWYESMPEDDPSITPPPKRYQPARGFGYAWREGGGQASLPLRGDLGWAIDEEAGFEAVLTYYPQGFYAPDCVWMPKSGVYEMTDNAGVRYQFVGAGGQALIVTPTP